MVLLTHPNVTLRPSKSVELDPLSNLTLIDATKPNANEDSFKKCFLCYKLIQCHPVRDHVLSAFAKFSKKLTYLTP